MYATLEKVRNLEQIYVRGYEDDFLDRALHKILAHQVASDQTSLRTLRADLDELERRYGMRSDVFAQRYSQGQTGDEADFVEWNALYRMHSKLQARLSILQGQTP